MILKTEAPRLHLPRAPPPTGFSGKLFLARVMPGLLQHPGASPGGSFRGTQRAMGQRKFHRRSWPRGPGITEGAGACVSVWQEEKWSEKLYPMAHFESLCLKHPPSSQLSTLLPRAGLVGPSSYTKFLLLVALNSSVFQGKGWAHYGGYQTLWPLILG